MNTMPSTPHTTILSSPTGWLEALATTIRESNYHPVLITDDRVYTHHGHQCHQYLQQQHIDHHRVIIRAGETHKNRQSKSFIEDQLQHRQCGRDTLIIALGGGMVLDLAGFVAATYARGIPVVYCPTTLLAMVDASIGGKTAINTPFAKNSIGVFKEPRHTLLAPHFLQSLPTSIWYEGLAEMLKHGLILNAEHYHQCSQLIRTGPPSPTIMHDLIMASRAIKQHVVDQDPLEKSRRSLLNFGHSIGHVLETISGFRLAHGAAVNLGMIAESYLSAQSGHLDQTVAASIQQTLRHMPFDYSQCMPLDPPTALSIWRQDKKNKNHQPHVVMLDAIGHCHQLEQQYCHPVSDTMAMNSLTWLNQFVRTLCLSPASVIVT